MDKLNEYFKREDEDNDLIDTDDDLLTPAVALIFSGLVTVAFIIAIAVAAYI